MPYALWQSLGVRWQATTALTLALLISSRLLGKLLRRAVLLPRFTAVDELPHIGIERKDGRRKESVVICGGRCVPSSQGDFVRRD